MNYDERAAEIRKRMDELRRELSCDVQDVGRSTRAMTDVGLYVQRYPWASVALAAAAGYLLVPRKKEVIQPDAETLARLVRRNQVRVETHAGEKSAEGMVKGLLAMALASAARLGMNYLMNRMSADGVNGRCRSAARRARPQSWKV